MKQGMLLRLIMCMLMTTCYIQAQEQVETATQEELPVETFQEALMPTISLERIAHRSEAYKAIIQRTLRNMKIAWFVGGASVVGATLYVILSHYDNANQRSDSAGSGAEASGRRGSHNKTTRDEAFNEWWAQEKKKNTTLLGGMQWGIYEGVRIAFVTFVVGLLLKVFDQAGGSFTKVSSAILGESADVLFNKVSQNFSMTFDCLCSSLQTLLYELDLFVSGSLQQASTEAKKAAVPSFFFESLLTDVQALALQLEEAMALIFAIMAVNEVENVQLEQETVAVYQAASRCIDFCVGLVENSHITHNAIIKTEGFLVVKKLDLAVGRYLATAKNVLFNA